MPVVYILQLKNDQYYIGSTDNIERRIHENNRGKTASTRNKLPVKLVFFQEFSDLRKARRVEYRLKRLKSRSVIEKIINNRKIDLKLLGV